MRETAYSAQGKERRRIPGISRKTRIKMGIGSKTILVS
jgi:hypothetical protein